MNKLTIDCLLSHPDSKLPTKVTENAAGFDLYSVENATLSPGQTKSLPTGLALCIPEGYYGKLETKSSFALKQLIVIGGIIDSDYRGEIHVILHNLSGESVEICRGIKFAQLLITAYEKHVCFRQQVALNLSVRGVHGFGSLD